MAKPTYDELVAEFNRALDFMEGMYLGAKMFRGHTGTLKITEEDSPELARFRKIVKAAKTE